MKQIVWKFGLISGAVLSALMAITVPLCMSGRIDFEKGPILGYASMVLAFLAVFFGVRAYRDSVGNGAITFGKAFKVGILIALVTCGMYVVVWEIVYWGFLPDFGDKYAVLHLERMRETGATAAEMAVEEQRMADFKRWYRNPLFNIGMTFMEVFPVGLVMTLVSAAILRKRPQDAMPAMA